MTGGPSIAAGSCIIVTEAVKALRRPLEFALRPAILMVKPAQDGLSSELAEPLHLSTARRILAQGQMRSEFVVITGVGRKDAAQVGLAEDDDMIEAFPADRANQSFRMPVLPR